MKDKPIAVCTICNKYSYNSTSINEQCSERAGKKRCKGVFQSAMNLDDWIICPSCKGKGTVDSSYCYTCQSSGWRFNRDK